jgi:hypothetical protein
MGSFNAICSITNTTLNCGDETTVQFMIPARPKGQSGSMFVDIFLKTAEEKGVDVATKQWEEATKNWGEEINHKGLEVSNDGACAHFLPFGPAIKGTYADYGNVEPIDTEENNRNIRILEGILHLPFKSIMEIATDDRWYKYSIKATDREKGSMDWGVKGVTKKTPEWLMDTYKKLTLTYVRTEVYDKLKSFEFSVEGGVMTKYEQKDKKEYIDGVRKEAKKYIERAVASSLKKVFKGNVDMYKVGAPLRETYHQKNVHACLVGGFEKTKEEGMEWYIEQCLFMYHLSGLCLKLQRSQYGSQHSNWNGFLQLLDGVREKSENEIKEEAE